MDKLTLVEHADDAAIETRGALKRMAKDLRVLQARTLAERGERAYRLMQAEAVNVTLNLAFQDVADKDRLHNTDLNARGWMRDKMDELRGMAKVAEEEHANLVKQQALLKREILARVLTDF